MVRFGPRQKIWLRPSRPLVTVRGYTILVCNQQLRPTQPLILSGMGNDRPKVVFCGCEGSPRSDIASNMHHRLSTDGLIWTYKGDEHLTYAYSLAVGVISGYQS